MSHTPYNKIIWTDEMIAFIKGNFYTITNKQISDSLGLKLSTVRRKALELGYKRIEMEYWTPEQIMFLKETFTTKGDKELSVIFNKKWKKNKPWTLKHIEKKRMYLKFCRSKKQIKAIRNRNMSLGYWDNAHKKHWHTRGAATIGTVKNWDNREFVKTEEGYESLNRYTWKLHHGKIPENMNVVRINPFRSYNDIDNLELLTNEQLGARNSINRYPKELIQTIFLLSKLNKTLNEKQNK